MLNTDDLMQIAQKGIDPALIEKQIDHFVRGFPYIKLERPALPGDGILLFNDQDANTYIDFYDCHAPALRVVKFVPASGAASRMFKALFEFRENPVVDNMEPHSPGYLFSHLKEIAFYHDLQAIMKRDGLDLDVLLTEKKHLPIVDYLLSSKGLNYAGLPKGLLKFHHYEEGARTAAEEHMVEGSTHARDRNNKVYLHFTISPEHRVSFQELITGAKPVLEQRLGVTFDISFSVQNPATDMLAVDENNQPFRDADGKLVFRPGGHGALLENLNAIQADLVFVKNIDNIVPDRLRSTTSRYKKLLGGYLLAIKEKIDGYLVRLDEATPDKHLCAEIAAFVSHDLLMSVPGKFNDLPLEIQREKLQYCLDRPVRVCGMVKNEGEPGGGPFWVRDEDGHVSLQIVESSQVNLKDAAQKAIFSASTHFNPVDLVCSTRDYKGETFRLEEFVDENTGFISLKSSHGRTLKAQELPGLWNGAMAGWITLFVEVPIITFNPVKTVNDLLRKEHRAQLSV